MLALVYLDTGGGLLGERWRELCGMFARLRAIEALRRR